MGVRFVWRHVVAGDPRADAFARPVLRVENRQSPARPREASRIRR